MKHIVDESKLLKLNPRVLAASVPGGYQYADIPAMGPSVMRVDFVRLPFAFGE